MRGSHFIWVVLIVHFATSPFYYMRWGLWGLIPDGAGFVLTALIAKILIQSEMKTRVARIDTIDQ